MRAPLWLVVALLMVAGFAVWSVPRISFAFRERDLNSQNMANAKMLALGCMLYAEKYDGRFPQRLSQVAPEFVPQDLFDQLKFYRHPDKEEAYDFIYFPGLDMESDASLPLIASPRVGRKSLPHGRGTRIIVKVDQAAAHEQESSYQEAVTAYHAFVDSRQTKEDTEAVPASPGAEASLPADAEDILVPSLPAPLATPERFYSVKERLEQYGEAARERMRGAFETSGLSYPPEELTLLGLKEERLLQVYARSGSGDWVQVLEYPVLAASGVAGPKLREGDLQVPEGIYPVELLNPNSRFHLSLRVGYPSADDRKQAQKEKRKNLGSDIMIHGGAASIGCVAIGDPAIEEVFILAADVGIKRIRVMLAPCDFRSREIPETKEAWIGERYIKLAEEMGNLPRRESESLPE